MAARNTTASGYGSAHQKKRAQLAPLVAVGATVCTRCHKRIMPGQKWVLDHVDHPAAHREGWYRGPSHWSCNQDARNAQPRRPPPPLPKPKALDFFTPRKP